MIEGVENSGIVSAMTKRRSSTLDLLLSEKSAGHEQTQPVQADTVSLFHPKVESITYSKTAAPDNQVGRAQFVLQKLIVKILQDQHIAGQIENGALESVNIDTMTPENAKALVASDEFWKAENTATRIMSFAVTINGTSPSKIGRMKESIDSGFQLARDAFKGNLPELAEETYAAVMEKIEAFADLLESD
jgi:hypothetical protein